MKPLWSVSVVIATSAPQPAAASATDLPQFTQQTFPEAEFRSEVGITVQSDLWCFVIGYNSD